MFKTSHSLNTCGGEVFSPGLSMVKRSFYTLSSVPVNMLNGLTSRLSDLASGQLCKDKTTLAHTAPLNMLFLVSCSYIFSQGNGDAKHFCMISWTAKKKPIKLDLHVKSKKDNKLRRLGLLQRQMGEAFRCLYFIRLYVISSLRVCMLCFYEATPMVDIKNRILLLLLSFKFYLRIWTQLNINCVVYNIRLKKD